MRRRLQILRSVLCWAAIMAILVAGLVTFVKRAHATEPTLLTVLPLPCDAAIYYWDTDGDPTTGAERVTVIATGEHTPRLTIEYGAGDNGVFLHATVVIPGRTSPHVRKFTDPQDLQAAYPHPCDLLAEVPQA